MKTLIVEDDYASRKFLYKFLSQYGECDLTVDGLEGLEAFLMAMQEGKPYDLVCLDIMMPKLDGIKTLKAIREIEKKEGLDYSLRTKVIMTTALNDNETVNQTFDNDCEAYAAKPINTEKFIEVLKKIGLI